MRVSDTMNKSELNKFKLVVDTQNKRLDVLESDMQACVRVFGLRV